MPGKYHFIAIGGSVMHSLAILLKNEGHEVTGSDDHIFGFAKEQLEKEGILPEQFGWDPSRVTEDLDGVILGMHAKKDNPELLRARELGTPVYSFPEYIYERSKNKQRIVIGGSHGKTTITAMVLHTLNFHNRDFDYVIGGKIPSLEGTIKLSGAPTIIIEGDEYPSSPIDPSPKFLKYNHHIGVISGIAWDHANVFPDEDLYIEQFVKFSDATPKGGTLIFNHLDLHAQSIGSIEREDVLQLPYKTFDHFTHNGATFLKDGARNVPLKIFGKHNMSNLAAAWSVIERLSITKEEFLEAISSFKGAARRLDITFQSDSLTIINDFAHAPSKVGASVLAVKEQHPERKLIALLELHTYSSLNKGFLPQYKDTMKHCDVPILYYNPKVVAEKNLEPISETDLQKAFNETDIKVFTDIHLLKDFLNSLSWNNSDLLIMSSGNLGGLSIEELTEKITN